MTAMPIPLRFDSDFNEDSLALMIILQVLRFFDVGSVQLQ